MVSTLKFYIENKQTKKTELTSSFQTLKSNWIENRHLGLACVATVEYFLNTFCFWIDFLSIPMTDKAFMSALLHKCTLKVKVSWQTMACNLLSIKEFAWLKTVLGFLAPWIRSSPKRKLVTSRQQSLWQIIVNPVSV